MGLDAALKLELLEAREKIRAQLEEIEFRVAAGGGSRLRRGPPDYRDVYAELQNELRDINELLEPDEEDQPVGKS